jgi:hypothetical protein
METLIKLTAGALLVTLGWCAKGWYQEHGFPVRVDVQVATTGSAPVKAPVVAAPASPKAVAPKATSKPVAAPQVRPEAKDGPEAGVSGPVPWDGSKANGVGYYSL